MGILYSRDYETLEGDNNEAGHAPLQTSLGGVEHNGWQVLKADRLPADQAQAQAAGPATDMANELPIQADSQTAAAMSSGHELDSFLGKAFEEKPVWTTLYENLRDVFFPVKLPPLQLTSTPIPVPDRMAVKANPWAIGISSSVNILIMLLAIWLGIHVVTNIVKPPTTATNIDVSDFDLKAPKAGIAAGGGGGGGSHDIVDPIKGKLPPRMKDPMAPPMVPILDHPKLSVPSAINVQQNIQLPDNPNLPNIGMAKSANVQLASNGQGGGGGMGSGYGGGMGSGTGDGFGPGQGGNAGGGLYQIGGGVSAPVAIFTPEAEFSDEARRAKYQGVCLISVIVDRQGNPQDPRVIRALGMGLDEKALEAVRKYKFKPAMKGNAPVPVRITIEVNFRLY